MYRIVIIAFGVLLCLAVLRAVTAENGAPVEKPAAAKGDREKVQTKRPAGLDDREDVQKPAPKANRDDKKPPVAAQPGPEKTPAAKPDQAITPPPAVNVEPKSAERPPAKPEREPAPAAKADSNNKMAPADGHGVLGQFVKPEPAKKTAPAVKLDGEDKKPSVAKVESAPAEPPAAKPRRETVQRHAKPPRHGARHGARTSRYAHRVARGGDAQVLRAREAWLRALAHKYGFSHW
jgi:hypothetical protein